MPTAPIVYVARDGSGDYNAGDTNADVQINAAIEYCYMHTGYTTVFMKAGTYVINNPIKMRANLILCGAGMYSTIIMLASGITSVTSSAYYVPDAWTQEYGPMVPLICPSGYSSYLSNNVVKTVSASASNTTFHDFQMNANYTGNSRVRRGRGYHNCIQMPISNNVAVYNVYMQNGAGDGLRVYAGTSGTVSGVYFNNNICHDLGHDCLFVLRGKDIYAHDNQITARTNACIRFNDVTNGNIYNNWLTAHQTYDSNPGIQLQRQDWATMYVNIYGNTIYQTWGCGILATIGWAGTIAYDGGNSRINIYHNMFYNCAINHSIPYSAGVVIYCMHNVTVYNNTFVGNYGGGVVLMGSTESMAPTYTGIRTTITNNIFMYNRPRKLNTAGTSTQANTGWGVQNRLGSSHTVICRYNCFYGNISGTYTGVAQAEYNLLVDPQMAAVSLTSGIGSQDYHLKSKSGRYSGGAWLKDTINSPCIDAGDPTFVYAEEPDGNGGRINIGMYGNTGEASLSAEVIKDSDNAVLRDTKISSLNMDTTHHNTTTLEVGIDTTDLYRSLVWFDLTAYKNISIESVILSLFWYLPSDRPVTTVVEVYRPAPWISDETTWNRYNNTTLWTSKGGDWYDKDEIYQGTAPYGKLVLEANISADNAYHDIDVTDLVKLYCNGVYGNAGFLLKASVEDQNTHNKVVFYSSNCGTNEAIPKLTIKTSTVIPTTEIIYVTSNTGTGMFKCDGIDDHVQINQAIKLAKENPTLYSGVYLSGPFTYNISSTILVAGILEGDSTAVVKLVDNANWATEVPMIKQYATGLDGVIIRGFKIDGNRAGNTNVVSGKGYYNLINLSNCSNISIYNMYLTNNHGDAVKLNDCASINYYNNTVYLIGHDGLYAINCTYVNAYDNVITCRTNSGLRLYNSNYVRFYRNDITSEGSGGSGIEIQKYGTPNMNDIEIYNNRIYGTVLAGIWVFSSSSYNASTANLAIRNNVIYNTGTKSTDPIAGGIVIQGFNATIENNTIDSCYRSGIGIRTTYTEAAVITGTCTVNIRNNNITWTDGYGIDYTTLANHSIVQSNNNMHLNSSGDYVGVTAPAGELANITVDPLYADREARNYYLKSKAGRWNPDINKWVVDLVSSPCIDAGYTGSEYSDEPEPNGSRVNIGAYGNTPKASYSGDAPVATNHPPVLADIANKTVEISDTLTFTITATDEDLDTLTYTAASVPEAVGATLNSSSGVFNWTPVVGQEGTYSVTFTVSDGAATDSQTISIGVVKQETYTITAGEIVANRLKEGSPTVVYNKLPYIDVGARLIEGVNKKHRTLILSDLSEYTGKTITSATLSIFWYHPDGKERVNDTIVEVYRPLPWDTSYATWNARTSSANWVSGGGDWIDAAETLNGAVPFASASFGNDTLPDNVYHELDVTALVQAYASGAYTNTGFLLKAQVEDDNYIAFHSQRFAISNRMLKLTIQYTD